MSISWLDYGPAPQLSDRPTPRNSPARFKRPVMAYPEWIAALPREAFVREEDISALMIAETRVQMAAEKKASKPVSKKKGLRGEMYV